MRGRCRRLLLVAGVRSSALAGAGQFSGVLNRHVKGEGDGVGDAEEDKSVKSLSLVSSAKTVHAAADGVQHLGDVERIKVARLANLEGRDKLPRRAPLKHHSLVTTGIFVHLVRGCSSPAASADSEAP